ncbi:MAG: heavy metal translocating P-type ATPase metal-binding domain-containing protein [Phycisphaerales bacterium]|jgi:Cu2+-exporting ATPase
MTAIAASSTVPAATTRQPCAHCGLPSPRGERFCCNGCHTAYDAIRACGLDQFYALKARLDDDRAPAVVEAGTFAELDDPTFIARHATAMPEGLMRVELYVQGVHCAACLWLLERLPTVVDGLRSVELDLARRTATVVWQPSETHLSTIARAFSSFGYPPHPVEPSAARDARRMEDRAYLIRIGVAAACAGNVMLLAFALYSGHFDAIAEPYRTAFRYLSAAIGLVALLWPGRVFVEGAVASLRTRTWHLDSPIALALVAGTIAGLFAVGLDTGEIYFDSITMLIFLLLIGRWLQMRQQRRAADAIEMLFSITPRRVTLIRDGQPTDAAIDAVKTGDLVEVSPQRCIPVDGIIETGSTHIDSAVLTGESKPLVGIVGSVVAAGALNLSSTIRVRVTATGRETRVGRLMADIERLSRSRTPVIGSADRLARPFVLGVIALSVACFLIRLPAGLDAAFESTVAMLIVCCPCAVALATPLATSMAIGRLAGRGTLVKGGDTFETLARAPTLVLDKTGTITEGAYRLRDWIGDPSLKPAIAALEAGGRHPIAQALAECAEFTDLAVENIEHHTGLGVTGTLSGRCLAVGSSRLMAQRGIPVPRWADDSASRAREAGLTAVFVGTSDGVGAVAVLGDAPREDARASIATLRDMGWKPRVLSGDDERTVRAVARSVGVEDARGDALPEIKRDRIQELNEDDATVMVGDGVNDAAALATATVGIAVRGGAEASMAASDVYLGRPGLSPLVDLAQTSRGVISRIRLCLALAVSYNIIAASLTLLGLMSPIVAAIIMPASSLTVLAIALGAGRSKPQASHTEATP